jgi:hypothetical protein
MICSTSKVVFSDTFIEIFGCRVLFCPGILEQSMGARNQVGIGLLYRPAGLNRLAESILGLLKSLKIPALSWFLYHGMVRNGIPRVYLYVFFVARKGTPSCVLFRGMVRNGIPRICIHFGSTKRNSELFSLPQKGSEQNYGSLFLFWVHRTVFRVVFSSAEGLGTEFRDFLFRGTTGIPSEITICSVYSVFRGIIFLSEIPNPNKGLLMHILSFSYSAMPSGVYIFERGGINMA